MKFSEMKLQARNAVRAYFIRNWRMENLMNSGEIPEHAHKSLKTVYLTLLCAMLSITFGSFLHLIWKVGGRFTVLSSVASLLCLYFTSPLRVRTRVSLLVYGACCLGASFDVFTIYLFEINLKETLVADCFVVGLFAPTLLIGLIWLESLFSRERSDIYLACLRYSLAIMSSTLVVTTSDAIDSHITHCLITVSILLALFLGYLVVYSQEILYDAHFGEINFVNRTLTIFFHIPGIVVHVARLWLGAEIEHHRQN